jgi:hypothetical protein
MDPAINGTVMQRVQPLLHRTGLDAIAAFTLGLPHSIFSHPKQILCRASSPI